MRNAQVLYTNDKQFALMGAAAMSVADLRTSELDDLKHTVPSEVQGQEKVIIISTRVASQLTKEQVAIIAAHEQGHITAGHLDVEDSETQHLVSGGSAIVVNERFELEADAAAAKIFGKEKVRECLLRVADVIVDGPLKDMFSEDGMELDETLMDLFRVKSIDAMQYRLDALA